VVGSYFDFYSSGILLDRNNCNQNSSVDLRLFSQIHILFFRESIYSDQVCPYSFRNADISSLCMEKISSSFLSTNKLGFLDLNEPIKNLNCTISHFQLFAYRLELNSKVLNENIFKNLSVLDLDGIVNSIQKDVFKNLNNLRIIRIRTQNIKNLFVKNNQWLDYINYYKKLPTSRSIDIKIAIDLITVLVLYQSIINVTYYEFPDEDICFFRKFPHFRFVLPDLKPTEYSKCSCTELFLIQYVYEIRNTIQYVLGKFITSYYLAEYYSDRITSNRYSRCFNKTFKEAIERCNFKIKFKNCHIDQATPSNNQFYFYIYDLIYVSKSIDFWLSKYINVIISIVAILTNIFIIIILSTKIIQDKLYVYLKLNSVLNLLFSLITLIRYIVNNEITSEQLKFSVYYQYFNIIFIKLIGNSIKTCSSISYLSFTLARYLNISNNQNSFLKILNTLPIKTYLLFVLILSGAINAFVYFEFTTVAFRSNINQFHFISGKNFTSYKQDSYNDYKETFDKVEYLMVKIFKCIKIIFSDLTLIILTLVTDVMLFVLVGKQSRNKRLKLSKRGKISKPIVSRLIVSVTTGDIRSKNLKEKKTISPKNRISKMIMYNGINFVLFRLPQAIVSLSVFIFKIDKEHGSFEPNLISYIVCKKIKICDSVEKISSCFYLISFLFQFYIFYKLDKNFKQSLVHLKNFFHKKEE